MTFGREQQENSEVLSFQGTSLLDEGDYEGALESAERVLKVDPDHAEALGTKGTVLRLRDDVETAAKELTRATQLAPNTAWVHAQLGETLRMQRRYEEALQALERALNLDPDYAFALGTKGTVLSEMRRYEEALQALEQALNLDPGYAFALGTKVTVLAEMDRYRDALATLDLAPAADPDYPYVLVVGGQILCDIAQYKLALRELNLALERESENVAALNLKGWALQNLGTHYLEEAPGVYETALERELSPIVEVHLRTNHGRALSLLGEEHRATIEYRHAIEKGNELTKTGDTDLLTSLAWCYLWLEQYGESVRLLTPVLSLDRTLVFAQFDLALALLHSGRHRHALREYHLALRLTQAKHILRRRGILHVASCDLEAAIAKRPSLAILDEVNETQRLLRNAQEDVEKESTTHLQEIEELQAKRG